VESRDHWLERSGSGVWQAGTLKVVVPLVSIKDRWVGPVSKYWTYRSHIGDMGPVTLVVGCQRKLDFSHYFIGYYGREAGYGPADQSTGVLWIMLGALLLRGSGSVQICWWLCKRLLYVDHVQYIWLKAICGPSVESVWCVGCIFPCRVYIDLNHRDSWIWVTACSWQTSRSKLID
jgi:hypothetical protein